MWRVGGPSVPGKIWFILHLRKCVLGCSIRQAAECSWGEMADDVRAKQGLCSWLSILPC